MDQAFLWKHQESKTRSSPNDNSLILQDQGFCAMFIVRTPLQGFLDIAKFSINKNWDHQFVL